MALTLFTNTFLLDATPYLEGEPSWAESSTPTKEQSLIRATAILNDNLWPGSAVSSNQPLAWPRTSITFWDPVLNLEVEVVQGAVPTRLEKAVALQALHLIKYPTLSTAYASTFDSIKVGPIELSNEDAASNPDRIPVSPGPVLSLLAPLFPQGFQSRTWWRTN